MTTTDIHQQGSSKLSKLNTQNMQLILWISALIVGATLGLFSIEWLNNSMDFIATVFTRLFQFLSVPTIALAIVNTLASMGKQASAGHIFRRTIQYTILTTAIAAIVGLLLYVVISPQAIATTGTNDVLSGEQISFYDHIISVIPNNTIQPFLAGNVLSILIIAFAVGIALANLPETEQKQTLTKVFLSLQDVVFYLIKWLIKVLPIGIVAFAAQLSAQLSSGVVAESLGKYVAVILCGNIFQFFIVLPLFLLSKGLSPIRTMSSMSPAILMALFTKSSAATLPVTIETAENRLHVNNRISRFVLPICTTVNMNGCAAFILVTSLFVMQNAGIELSVSTMLIWLVISVVSAIGNAGVPMGCYFLTFSLMSGMGVPVAILGMILPIYTIIDMIETAENVWSDSCICAAVNKDLSTQV
ncbi:MAG: dicarboxylate/amino acid:cation symporter [Marinilabiliaceae bacterium]|nr:dicarboxylate/amino acid:cation symporter [Marinilabiliaceae bacterium]